MRHTLHWSRTLRFIGRAISFLTRWPTTVYGVDTAMHGAVRLSTPRWGDLTLEPGWGRVGWAVWLSPNGTPWASTWGIGPGFLMHDPRDRQMVAVRRAIWGHGYDSNRLDPQLLDKALWAVDTRHPMWLGEFTRMFEERAAWLEEDARG